MTLKSLLAYGRPFQLKVLGALLTDKKFLLNVRDILHSHYFDSDSHKWIIDQVLLYFDKYHTSIPMDVLKVELQKVENDVLQVAVKEELRHSYSASEEDLKYVEEEFTAFCRNQSMKAAILESADLLKDGDFDGIRDRVERAMKAGMDKNLGHEYNKDVEARYRDDYRNPVPFPWDILNELTQGGLGAGDLGIIFGNPGGGKCVDYNTEIEIRYPVYKFKLRNNVGQEYLMEVNPWDEFNIEGVHLYGWQAYLLLTGSKLERK